MKNIISVFIAIILLVSCSSKKDYAVTITNPSNFDRTTELVEISLDSIQDKVKLTDTLSYIVKTNDGKEIPSQVTYDRKLIFQPEIKAGESKSFLIVTGTPEKYEPRTYGRFITERKDDFAWENDRVAFRAYGPALVPIDGPSNGFDAWYKRTNNLIIDKWYKDDLEGIASYHKDNGEGLDDYKVGRSLGAGAMAPYVNDKLWLNENFASQEVLENGPLRTTFKLTYNNLDVDGKSIAESRTISIDAGSQLSKVIQAYTIKEPMQVAAGFPQRGKDDIVVTGDDYLIYVEPESKLSAEAYFTLVFPAGMESSKVDTYEIIHPKSKKTETHTHVLGITIQQPRIPVTYYTGYGWSKFGFSSVADFEKYVKEFSEALKQPLTIKY